MFLRLLLQRCAAPMIIIVATSAYCSAAFGESSSVVDSLLELSDPLESGWALGDFDGDHETDIAVSRDVGQSDSGYVYRLELKLSRSSISRSFTFGSMDAVGVNVAAVDVDGDHDLDLVITDQFSRQRIGVWINDGKGNFTQNLHTLYWASADLLLRSLRLDVPTQGIDEKASQRLRAFLPRAGFVRVASFSLRAEFGTAGDCEFSFQNGPHCPRAPPTVSSILVHL